MLPLPFAVCARPCATNAVLCARDGQRFLPFARAPIEAAPSHAFLNPTDCEIECSNHPPRRVGEFRLMNAAIGGARSGAIHSFWGTLLGLQGRLALSVGRPRGHSKNWRLPPLPLQSVGAKRRFASWRPQRICFIAFSIDLRGAARRDFSPLRATSTLSIYIRLASMA